MRIGINEQYCLKPDNRMICNYGYFTFRKNTDICKPLLDLLI